MSSRALSRRKLLARALAAAGASALSTRIPFAGASASSRGRSEAAPGEATRNGAPGDTARKGAPASPASSAARPVIIDTDPGVDDALAIFLALRSPEIDVKAVTAVAGNMPLDITLPNALRLLEIAGRSDIPVAAGASRPLRRQLVTAPHIHGKNGLGDVEFPEPRTKAVAETAVHLLRRIVRASPGEVSIIAIAPLTNLASAFREDPGLPRLIRGITLMGGSLSGGNVTPAAEFNVYADPEAAQAVFASGAKITMVGLDVTRKVALDESHVRALEAADDPVAHAAGRLMRAMLTRARALGPKDSHMLVHDAMAVAAFVDPSLCSFQPVHIEVETQGELTAGETVGYRHAPIKASAPLADAQARPEPAFAPNADVAIEVDAPRAVSLLVDRLARPKARA